MSFLFFKTAKYFLCLITYIYTKGDSLSAESRPSSVMLCRGHDARMSCRTIRGLSAGHGGSSGKLPGNIPEYGGCLFEPAERILRKFSLSRYYRRSSRLAFLNIREAFLTSLNAFLSNRETFFTFRKAFFSIRERKICRIYAFSDFQSIEKQVKKAHFSRQNAFFSIFFHFFSHHINKSTKCNAY